jgi:dihydropteroate synthase
VNHWTCGRFSLDLSMPLVMGIVNFTPDSFSDGREKLTPSDVIAHAERLMLEGAAIIDIGAESTRPGATPLPLAEELTRLMPVLQGLRDAPVPVSIDTYKPEVMRAAIDLGASIVNDVYAFRQRGALEVVAEQNCGLVVMHMQGEPATMHVAPHYQDVVGEVSEFLRQRLLEMSAAGIERSRLMVDPGFGFGKRLEDNHALLTRLASYRMLDSAGLLVGLSRKGMLGTISGRLVARERLGASVAAALLAVSRGAQVVRCHDVAATVDALKIWSYFQDDGS